MFHAHHCVISWSTVVHLVYQIILLCDHPLTQRPPLVSRVSKNAVKAYCRQKKYPKFNEVHSFRSHMCGDIRLLKLHNVINVSNKEGQRIPRRNNRKLLLWFHRLAFPNLKAFMVQTKRNFRLKNVISGLSLSQ